MFICYKHCKMGVHKPFDCNPPVDGERASGRSCARSADPRCPNHSFPTSEQSITHKQLALQRGFTDSRVILP